MYNRIIKSQILDKFFSGRAIVIIGARRVGKTTLVNNILLDNNYQDNIIKFNGDNPTDREQLNDRDIEHLKDMVGDKKIIFIDEAQKINSIGQTAKLLIDEFGKKRQIILTGSSSLNLLDKTSEPLTGRKWIFQLFPLSLEEIYAGKSSIDIQKKLNSHLIFGSYPDVVKANGFADKEETLIELASSYLYKDILDFQDIRNSSVIMALLKALSLQVGSEVSYNEISSLVGIDKKTVERYVDLLEKNQVVFRLSPYAKNQRRAISKLRKIYFYDLGIRNAVTNNFNLMEDRNDAGALWENFILVERLKYQGYHKLRKNNYFLRTYDGAEIDLIEERGGELRGFEFKWTKRQNIPPGNLGGINYKIVRPSDMKGFVL